LQTRAVLFGVSLLAMLWGYQLMLLEHAPMAFNGKMEDLSYGWYVPVFSLYVVWRERNRIRASLGDPSLFGVLLALPCLFAGFLGTRGSQLRLEIVGFAGLLVTLTWAFWGIKTAKRILFPALFLLFCMPLHSFLDIVTIHLRMFAVGSAYGILRGLGVDIVREGTMLLSPTGVFAIDVADPCSGMRSLFAMMAVSVGYAYFTQPTWLRRGLLFAISIPIVILGNVTRIFTIVLTAVTCSPEFATGFYHDYSGYVVFLVSIALMVGVGGLISRLFGPQRVTEAKDDADAAAKPAQDRSHAWRLPCSALLCLAVVSCMVYQAKTVDPVLCEPPAVALGELAGYTSEIREPGEAELTSLPADTRFVKRAYAADDGHWFMVSVVIGGKSKSSIHRPEMCLPSQGNQMMNPHDLTVDGRDWHGVTLAHRDRPPIGFAYTFFNQAGYRTASHVRRIFRDVWDRSVLGRIDRWVMVTVASSTTDDARMSEFLSKLAEAMP